MKSNTAECATMATYWDPGHFITGIAQRPVIYDGAGQNNLLYLNATRINALGINITKYSEGINIETYDKGIKIVTVREGSNLTKSRMKDVASAMFTDNESLAVELLKSYRNNGCNEFYFIASSDLIFKSQWWTYFSTWDPTKICEGQLCKGDRHIYSALQLTKRRPLFSINAMGYEYQISDRQSMVVYEQNGTYKALFQQDNQFVRINRVIYPTQTGYAVSTETGAEVPGTILLADPSLSYIFYLPPQLENSMFTKMFFFNGASLKNFKFVKDWEGEVKLFKVKFDD
jgi:dolichyl-diphosphooligosaccharide--protein glycosyltransferase